MTNGGKILIIAIATLILALTAPINAQQLSTWTIKHPTVLYVH